MLLDEGAVCIECGMVCMNYEWSGGWRAASDGIDDYVCAECLDAEIDQMNRDDDWHSDECEDDSEDEF